MIASTVAKGKENGKRADKESTTTTIISLSQQMAHKHSRRMRRNGRQRIWQATRVNQPNRSMIYKKEEVAHGKTRVLAVRKVPTGISTLENCTASVAVVFII